MFRIQWKIGPVAGCGQWLANSRWWEIQQQVAFLNHRFGYGTHWVEPDDDPPAAVAVLAMSVIRRAQAAAKRRVG